MVLPLKDRHTPRVNTLCPITCEHLQNSYGIGRPLFMPVEGCCLCQWLQSESLRSLAASVPA